MPKQSQKSLVNKLYIYGLHVDLLFKSLILIVGSEDCLYLNIYVPRENPHENDNLDVVVHIHAGGFMSGSGHMFAGPNYLLDRELILVTINYRIGALGKYESLI